MPGRARGKITRTARTKMSYEPDFDSGSQRRTGLTSVRAGFIYFQAPGNKIPCHQMENPMAGFGKTPGDGDLVDARLTAGSYVRLQRAAALDPIVRRRLRQLRGRIRRRAKIVVRALGVIRGDEVHGLL